MQIDGISFTFYLRISIGMEYYRYSFLVGGFILLETHHITVRTKDMPDFHSRIKEITVFIT